MISNIKTRLLVALFVILGCGQSFGAVVEIGLPCNLAGMSLSPAVAAQSPYFSAGTATGTGDFAFDTTANQVVAYIGNCYSPSGMIPAPQIVYAANVPPPSCPAGTVVASNPAYYGTFNVNIPGATSPLVISLLGSCPPSSMSVAQQTQSSCYPSSLQMTCAAAVAAGLAPAGYVFGTPTVMQYNGGNSANPPCAPPVYIGGCTTAAAVAASPNVTTTQSNLTVPCTQYQTYVSYNPTWVWNGVPTSVTSATSTSTGTVTFAQSQYTNASTGAAIPGIPPVNTYVSDTCAAPPPPCTTSTTTMACSSAGSYGIPSGQTSGTATLNVQTCGTNAPTYTYVSGCSAPPACTTSTTTMACSTVAGQPQYGVASSNTQGSANLTVQTCGTSAPTYTYTGGCSTPPPPATTPTGSGTPFPVTSINTTNFPTLYVYGDVPMFQQMLNATAMVFSSSLFSGGGILMMLGGLVSLIVLGLRAISHKPGGLRVQAFFIVLLFYWTGISVQTNVNIEDIFTGNVTSVANVPIFVSVPAGVFSAAAFTLTQTMETAFQVPARTTAGATLNGFISLQNGGFTNPLQLLTSLRCTAHTSCATALFPFYARDLQNFEIYCAIPSQPFSRKDLNAAPNAVNYLLSLPVMGLMTYYNDANPKGVTIPCADAQTAMNLWFANLTANGNTNNQQLSNLISSNMIANQPVNSTLTSINTGSQIGLTAFQNAYLAIINGSNAQSAAQSGQDFMMNEMFGDMINDTFKCMPNSGNLSTFQTCASAIAQRSALEQSKTDNAGAASLFERTMFPTMNLLLMLFFGLAPLVAIVILMAPETTMKILGSYILFGVWTQSWMPVATIINYYIELQAQQATAAFTVLAPLNIQNMHAYLDNISTQVGLASQMLAATPMITMAVLSGSMFAVTGLSSQIMGKDHFDESLASPDLAKGNFVTQVGGRTGIQTLNTSSQITGGGFGTNAPEYKNLDTFNFNTRSARSEVIGKSNENARSFTQAYIENISHGLEASTGQGNLYQAAQNYGDMVQNTDSNTWKQAESFVNDITKGTGISAETKKALVGAVSAGFAMKLGAPGLIQLMEKAVGLDVSLNGGASLESSNSASTTEKTSVMKNLKEALSSDYTKTHAVQSMQNSGNTQTLTHSLSDAMTKKDGQSWQDNKTASETWQRKATEAEQLSKDVNTEQSYNGVQFATTFGANPMFVNAVNSIMGGMSNEESAFIDSRAERIKDTFGISADSSPEVQSAALTAARAIAIRERGGDNAYWIDNALLNAAGTQNLAEVKNGSTVGPATSEALGKGGNLTREAAKNTAGVPVKVAPAADQTTVNNSNLPPIPVLPGPTDLAKNNTQGPGTAAPLTPEEVKSMGGVYGTWTGEVNKQNEINQAGIPVVGSVIKVHKSLKDYLSSH